MNVKANTPLMQYFTAEGLIKRIDTCYVLEITKFCH